MEFDNETIRIAVQLYVINEKEGEEKYGHINTWKVSGVTDMSQLFRGTLKPNAFNQPLNNWDVGNVTDMRGMFYHTSSFNQPLDKWNVSNVTNMHSMFGSAKSFNQPLNKWNVSNVTNMYMMFGFAKSFNQPLDKWDVGNVIHMEWMFCNALSFNQPLDNWNVSNVTGMNKMFEKASSFNQPLNNWDVGCLDDTKIYSIICGMFNSTTIGEMLKKHNLTTKNYFDKNVYHEVFVWPRKKDYVTFLVNNQYLPLNKHQEEHEYHPLFDNTDMSQYIACYL
jgi:surface protein